MLKQEDIKKWLESKPCDEIITHMLVICDKFDYEYYPKYVSETENVQDILAKYESMTMQEVMEVYNFSLDLVQQLNERRSMNL